jgi:hypothetical protein
LPQVGDLDLLFLGEFFRSFQRRVEARHFGAQAASCWLSRAAWARASSLKRRSAARRCPFPPAPRPSA